MVDKEFQFRKEQQKQQIQPELNTDNILERIDKVISIQSRYKTILNEQTHKKTQLLNDVGDYETETLKKESQYADDWGAINYLQNIVAKLIRFIETSTGVESKMEGWTVETESLLKDIEMQIRKLNK